MRTPAALSSSRHALGTCAAPGPARERRRGVFSARPGAGEGGRCVKAGGGLAGEALHLARPPATSCRPAGVPAWQAGTRPAPTHRGYVIDAARPLQEAVQQLLASVRRLPHALGQCAQLICGFAQQHEACGRGRGGWMGGRVGAEPSAGRSLILRMFMCTPGAPLAAVPHARSGHQPRSPSASTRAADTACAASSCDAATS